MRTGDGNWTALHIAANWNRLALIEALVQSGVDVNALTLKGETAYDVAFGGGHWEMMALLEKNGGVSGDEVRKRKR